MLQGIGSYSSSSATRLSQMLSKLDTNNDGTINRAEFVAGKPTDVSANDAGTLFDTLDTSKSGSMSASDMATAFQQMGSAMQSALIQAQSDNSATSTSTDATTASADGSATGTVQGGHHHGHGGHGAAKMFDALDTNGDGTVSKDEFVAGAPQGVTADQAGGLFDKISNGNGDSLTKDQFVSGFKSVASTDQDDAATSTASTASTTANSSADPGALLDQLLATLQGGAQSGAAGSSPPDPSQMFASLDSNGDGTVTKAEFVAGAPKGVSSDQASAFFDKISNGNGDSLSKDQFVSGLQNAGPPGSSGTTATASSDPGQLLDQLLASLGQSTASSTTTAAATASSSTAATTATASTTATDGLTTAQTDAAQLLDQFIRAVGSYQNTAYQSRFSSASLDNSSFLTSSVAA